MIYNFENKDYDFGYRSILEDYRVNGLNHKEIQRSSEILSEKINDIFYLKDIAYKPTGVAFGCPLPSPNIIDKIWRVAQLFEHFLKSITPEKKQNIFAYVPSDSYHITVVNHSHFDVNASITQINLDQKHTIQKIIQKQNYGNIIFHFSDLIITRSGRLIIPGFPSNNKLFLLRNSLTESIPQLNTNIPSLAPIKIGHLLAPFDYNYNNLLLSFIRRLGKLINFSINFNDIYTPIGRILL